MDQPSDASQRDLSAWCLLAALALLAAMAAPLVAGYFYTGDDLGAFHLPVRAFYAQRLAAAEPFDWMPQLFCGFYLSGEGQAGTYHPLHFLLYRFLPLRTAMGWELLAGYPLLLAGTYLFLRRLIGRRDAAMFGGLIFTFCSFNLLHFIHPNAVAVVAHVPWLLWTIDIVIADTLAAEPHRRGAAAATLGIALLTGSQLLLGYPQYVWFSLLAETAYVLFAVKSRSPDTRDGEAGSANSAGRGPRVGRLVARLAAAKAIGVLIGCVQLLPTADALVHSARRTADADFANSGSLDPLNLVQWVAPYLFVTRVVGQNTHELALYLGAVPLVLIAWLFMRWRDLGALRRPAWAAVGFGVLTLLLAFGQHGYLYRLQRFLPAVGSFRFPCRYTVLFQFCAAVLAAIGFVLLVRQREQNEKAPWRELFPLWRIVAAALLAAVAGMALREKPYIALTAAIWAGPLLIGSAAVLLALAARGVPGAMAGLVLFAAADLGCYGLSYSIYPHADRLESFLAETMTPPGPSGGRILADVLRCDEPGLHTGNRMALLGWRRADGYAGLEPARRLDYRQLAALRVAGVEWVKRQEATDAIQGLVPYDDHWLRVSRPLPRAWLATCARTSCDPAADLERIPVESTALTEDPLELPGGRAGSASVVCERPGRLEIQVDSPSTQLLVVSESFHSGWQARLDGEPQPVLRVDGDFLGCLVEPGRHQLTLEFRPRSLCYGRILSLLGLGLAAACLATPLLRLRRKLT